MNQNVFYFIFCSYVQRIIVPYVKEQRKLQRLPKTQKALVLFDVFKAHQSEKVLNALKRANIVVLFVPANCTDHLQPMDQHVNKSFKDMLKSEFQSWYSDKVVNGLKNGSEVEDIIKSIDLRMSAVKHVHAAWLVRVFTNLAKRSDIILESFSGACITQAVTNGRE